MESPQLWWPNWKPLHYDSRREVDWRESQELAMTVVRCPYYNECGSCPFQDTCPLSTADCAAKDDRPKGEHRWGYVKKLGS